MEDDFEDVYASWCEGLISSSSESDDSSSGGESDREEEAGEEEDFDIGKHEFEKR